MENIKEEELRKGDYFLLQENPGCNMPGCSIYLVIYIIKKKDEWNTYFAKVLNVEKLHECSVRSHESGVVDNGFPIYIGNTCTKILKEEIPLMKMMR